MTSGHAPLQSAEPDRIPESDPKLPATLLSAGECGLICGIDGNHEDIERLKTMGVCLGRRLHVVKSGEPMIVSVMGTRLGIAEKLARHVFLRPDRDHRCFERHPAN